MTFLVDPYLKNCNATVIGVVAHPVRLHLDMDGVLGHLSVGQTDGVREFARTRNESLSRCASGTNVSHKVEDALTNPFVLRPSVVGPNQPFYFSSLDVPQRIRVGSRIQALRLGPLKIPSSQ